MSMQELPGNELQPHGSWEISLGSQDLPAAFGKPAATRAIARFSWREGNRTVTPISLMSDQGIIGHDISRYPDVGFDREAAETFVRDTYRLPSLPPEFAEMVDIHTSLDADKDMRTEWQQVLDRRNSLTTSVDVYTAVADTI